jgi:hypothetical protein
MSDPDTTADAIRDLLQEVLSSVPDEIDPNLDIESRLNAIAAHAVRLEDERDALQQRVEAERDDDVEDDIGVIPPIRTDKMVMLSQPIYERQVEELDQCKQRVERLRAYSDGLAWWLALDTIEGLMEEHLQPGDLGDKTEGAGRDRTLDT